MQGTEIIEQAAKLVGGERNEQYGDIVDCHQKIADLWSAYLGSDVSPQDVAILMALLKIARTKTGAHKLDNYVDLAGYAGVAGEIAERVNADK